MRNCVILLVNSYPYSGGGDFWIQELPTLSERFEKIYIFAFAGAEDEVNYAYYITFFALSA